MKHLSGHIAYLFAMKLGIPHQPAASAKVECHSTAAVVHRQHEAISFYSALVAEGFAKGFAKGYAGVLDGVMLIHPSVAFHLDSEVDT